MIIRKIAIIFGAVALSAASLFGLKTQEITLGGQPALTVAQGGTGTSTVPTNYVLMGYDALHLTAVATSALGITGSADGTWSTTSASYFSSLGLAFSTTSANYWETQQAARGGGGGAWPFTYSTAFTSAGAQATTSLMGFTGGIYATASSTIGGGTAITGLTINGGGTSTAGFVNTSGSIKSTNNTAALALLLDSGSDNAGLTFQNAGTARISIRQSGGQLIVDNAGLFRQFTVNPTPDGSGTKGISFNPTFNTAATALTGLDLSVTNTASLLGSYLVNFRTTNGRSKFNIDAHTNAVGIGTSSPYAMLSIEAASTTGGLAPTTLFAISSTTGGTATSTLFTVSNTGLASTTLFAGAGLYDCQGASNKLTYSSAAQKFLCEGDQTGGAGGAWPFTVTDTNYGVAVQSTTTPEWFKNGLMASSTSYFENASSSLFTSPVVYTNRIRPRDPSASVFLTNDAFDNYLELGTSYITVYSSNSLVFDSDGTMTWNALGEDYKFQSATGPIYGVLDFSSVTGSDKTFTFPNTTGTLCITTACDGAFSTTSASYFSSLGLAFSTTSANYWKAQQTFTGASTTLLADKNTWSAVNVFSNATTTQLTATDAWITKLRNLTSNGFVKTSGSDGTLSIDTTSYTASTRNLTIAGTAGQITSSAAAQDLSADRTWTLSLPSHVIFPGSFNVANSTSTNATSTTFFATFASTTNATSTRFFANYASSSFFAANQATTTWLSATYASTTNLIVSGIRSALLLTGTDGTVSSYGGVTCTNQFVRILSAAGAGTCASVANTDLTNSSVTVTAGSGLGGGGTVSLGSSITIYDSSPISTSSAETRGQLAAWGSTNGTPATLYSVATTSASCSGSVSCTAFTVIGASPITISGTGGSGNMSGWATTTTAWSQMILYPVGGSDTDVMFGGSSSTSTAPFWWDVSDNTAYIGTSTLKSAAWKDSSVQFGPTGYTWTMGYDLTDDTFAIASSTSLGSSNIFQIAKATGITTFNYGVTMPAATSTAFFATYASTTNSTSTRLFTSLASSTALYALNGSFYRATTTVNHHFGGGFTSVPSSIYGLGSTTPSSLWGISIGTTTVIQNAQLAISIASSTSAAAVQTINWDTGNNQRFILSAAATTLVLNSTSSNPRDGAHYRVMICQDNTGSRTLTWSDPGRIVWTQNGTTSPRVTANTLTIQEFLYDGRVQRYIALASSSPISTNACRP